MNSLLSEVLSGDQGAPFWSDRVVKMINSEGKWRSPELRAVLQTARSIVCEGIRD